MQPLFIILTLLSSAMLISATRLPFPNSEINWESSSFEESLSSSGPRQISPEIVRDLIEISDIIPKAAIDVVYTKHIVFDTDFRRALHFLKSSQCTALLNKLKDEPEIIELLDFLHVLEPASMGNDLSVPYLEIVLLKASKQKEQQFRLTKRSVASATETTPTANLKSFIGAIRELLVYLPHDKYVNLIKEKCQKSPVFANFYKALRSEQFRPKVEAALASKNLSSYIKTLSSHSIDVKALVPIAFTVISWGPTI